MTTLTRTHVHAEPAVERWCLIALLQSLLRRRREMVRITERARRERARLGLGHLPQRLWDRRSALFIDR